MTAPETNGNGGYTAKEMLVRIDGKLDVAIGRIGAVELDVAVHKAQEAHSPGVIEEVRREMGKIRRRLAYLSGLAAGLIVAVPLIIRWMFR